MSNMPPIRRTIKNVVRNYSEAQVKVREATSNDPWGPSSTLMGEIADLTYNVVAFTEVMQMIWKRLNDHGKNWRHVYKALVLLDYIIKTGSEKVAQQCKENIYAIQTLKDFQHKEDNRDQGMNVREKAKQLVALLKDDERLRNERAKALKAKERFAQSAMGIGSDNKIKYGAGSPSLETSSGGYADPYGGATGDALSGGGSETSSPTEGTGRRLSTDVEYARPSSVGEEEIQLQLALAMSKEEHDENVRKQKSDDIKLQMALDESRKQAVEEERKKETSNKTDPTKTTKAPPSDPWGIPAQPAPTDPWGSPLPGPPGQAPRAQPPPPGAAADPWGSPAKVPAPVSNTDPWGAPAPAPVNVSPVPPPYPTASSTDPWGTSSGTSNQSSPWGSPAPPQQTVVSDPTPFDSNFTASGGPQVTNGSGVDDAFDLIGNRSAGSSPAKTNKELEAFDPLGEPKKEDAWNMGGMNDGLTNVQQQQQKHRKTPQEFLGDNASLVNLDQLVASENTQAKNPFAAKTTNPFELQQQQQQQMTRMTLNQMQTNTYNSGFSQPSSSTLLPNPLVPMNNGSMQSQNPFL
ncbi:epsin-2-like isoform X1 [Pecten maximus]|uniref:epsin-2-like isoform X1 n=1 Tax=Pecten maximus TaxID=6579 RepID=UPI001458411D|nr:epsin-2-like isoform X1 [Pecten maximus]